MNLPNLKGLGKADFVNILENTKNADAISFAEAIKREHAQYVPVASHDLHPLEWWNYKYQGERLFCNNNRLFVFLAYTNQFVDGRELKGKTGPIGEKINSFLDHITRENIHTVHYHYDDKRTGLTGNYTAYSMSTIYYEK